MNVSTTALSTSNVYFNKSQNILKIRHRAYIGYYSLLATIIPAIYSIFNEQNTMTAESVSLHIVFVIILCSSFMVYTIYLIFKGREYKIYYIIARCQEWLNEYFSHHSIASADWEKVIGKMCLDTLIDYDKTYGIYIFAMMLENYPEYENQILDGIHAYVAHKN